MDEIEQLEIECDRIAEEFLALNWGTSKAKVRGAVSEMLGGAKIFSSSMAWLLKESSKLPVQDEPARKLHDLVDAISALRMRKNQIESAEEPEQGAA
jgi:hypothetical protein